MLLTATFIQDACWRPLIDVAANALWIHSLLKMYSYMRLVNVYNYFVLQYYHEGDEYPIMSAVFNYDYEFNAIYMLSQ